MGVLSPKGRLGGCAFPGTIAQEFFSYPPLSRRFRPRVPDEVRRSPLSGGGGDRGHPGPWLIRLRIGRIDGGLSGCLPEGPSVQRRHGTRPRTPEPEDDYHPGNLPGGPPPEGPGLIGTLRRRGQQVGPGRGPRGQEKRPRREPAPQSSGTIGPWYWVSSNPPGKIHSFLEGLSSFAAGKTWPVSLGVRFPREAMGICSFCFERPRAVETSRFAGGGPVGGRQRAANIRGPGPLGDQKFFRSS